MLIRLAENFRAVFYAPFYAMLALGFCADEGIDIELVDSANPGDGVAALLQGRVDITWAGPMRVIKARDGNKASPLVCFGQVVGRDPFCLVGRGSRGGENFRLPELAALRFAAVCEVPTPWLCLQHDLREHGIDPDRLARAPDRPMRENLEALRQGRLDVAQLFEPFVSMAVQEGSGDILYAASMRGPTVYTTFIAAREAVVRNRGAFGGVLRALGRMQRWLAECDGAQLAATTASFYPDIAPDLLARALQRYREYAVWSGTPQVSREGFARLAASLHSGGFVSDLPRYEDCVAEIPAET
jgi:NitT/TauT family transport system substrate-binding protein